MMQDTRTDAPIDRMRIMVEYAEQGVVGKVDSEKVDLAWRRYLKVAREDLRAICDHPDAPVLLLRLRECGPGWPTRAANLERAMKGERVRAQKERRREAWGTDVMPYEPAVWDILDKTGAEDPTPRKTVRNIALVLDHDSRWKGRIRQNDFSGTVEIDGEPLRDQVTTRIVVWLDEHYQIDVRSALADEAIRMVAEDHGYHPVRDYLDGLEWDGRSRLPDLLEGYFGATPASAEVADLFRKLSAAFMISCVARVSDPGCKVDTMLVLQGAQGAGKSTAIRALVGDDWYSDTDLDPSGKDAYVQILGTWVYEIGEVEKWNGRRDQATIKAFLTSGSDRYRPPYGRNVVDQKRQVVFVGSTNAREFLVDHTGSRRYWPVRVDSPDVSGIRADRDQLWAEALVCYRRGDPWHLGREDAEVLARSSEDFAEVDPWTEPIAAWVESKGDRFELSHMLSEAVGLEVSKQHAGTAKRAGAILRNLGLESERGKRVDGRRPMIWVWAPKD